MFSPAKLIADTLIYHNFQAFVVGGAVRDSILMRKPKDIDLASNATPTQIMDLFSSLNFNVIPTGLPYGTVTVICNSTPFEITTFRKDISTDGRHAVVSFANSIEQDLARRDFTFNAIAYNMKSHSFIDPFNGKIDLSSFTIKTVGDPYHRFCEDYLRIVRACRFSAIHPYASIHSKTFDALADLANYINLLNDGLAPDRIRNEFLAAMHYPAPSNMFINLYKSNFLIQLLPELHNCVNVTQNVYHNVYRHKKSRKLYVFNHKKLIPLFH